MKNDGMLRLTIVLLLVLACVACGDARRAVQPDSGAGMFSEPVADEEPQSVPDAGPAPEQPGGDEPSGFGDPVDDGAPSAGGIDGGPTPGTPEAPLHDAAADTPRADGGTDGMAPPEDANECLRDIRGEGPGPFRYEAVRVDRVNLWVPEVPAGCRVPIVHFGTATGADCQRTYGEVLERIASHGFLTACVDNSPGQVEDCVRAVDTALSEYPDLADRKLGSAGHHGGGVSAIACAYVLEDRWGASSRIATHSAEPDLAGVRTEWQELVPKVTSPVFIFSSMEDGLVPEGWTREVFEALSPTVEARWYEANGAKLLPISWMQDSIVPWFRWKLLGDAAACRHIQALPEADRWDLKEDHNPSSC